MRSALLKYDSRARGWHRLTAKVRRRGRRREARAAGGSRRELKWERDCYATKEESNP
jgi:hypothetical protein